MTVEIALVIAVLGFCVSLYFNMTSSRRSTKDADQREATALAKVDTKLDGIGDDVGEIKQDVKDMRSDMGDMRERLTAVEKSSKSAHERINDIVSGVIVVNRGGKH